MKVSTLLMAIGAAGLALAGIGLVLDRLYPPQLNFVEPPPGIPVAAAEQAPKEITISDLGIDLEIVPGDIQNGVWSISSDKATYLATSASPGTDGNIVVYGHDSASVFGKLKRAKEGQRIVINTEDGAGHTYEITEIFSTTPENIGVISPTDAETLTIYTCTGLFNEQRLIVRAQPL